MRRIARYTLIAAAVAMASPAAAVGRAAPLPTAQPAVETGISETGAFVQNVHHRRRGFGRGRGLGLFLGGAVVGGIIAHGLSRRRHYDYHDGYHHRGFRRSRRHYYRDYGDDYRGSHYYRRHHNNGEYYGR